MNAATFAVSHCRSCGSGAVWHLSRELFGEWLCAACWRMLHDLLLGKEWTMNTANPAALRHGLAQIPRDGLERLLAHIDAERPLLLDGLVYRPELEYG